MMHALAPLLLIVLTLGWFLLAMAPALHEHFVRRDISPLRVASAAADIRYFGLSFQSFVERQLESLRARAQAELPHVTTLADGSGVWYAPHASDASAVPVVFAGARDEQVVEGLVVIAEGGIRAPDGTHVLKELYTGASLDAGMGCVFRAVLAWGSASLGPNNEVLRWVNTGGAFSAGMDSVLWGRASSWGTMSLSEGVRFQRIAAPRIEMGWPLREIEPDMRPRPPMAATKRVAMLASRWIVEGDFTVPPGVLFSADLIVSGTLHVGKGALLRGAVRCDALVAADDCIFMRSVIGAKQLALGNRCHVTGPVVVEGEATFGDDCRVGDKESPTTISVVSVRFGNGVVVCGEVWARRQGEVRGISSRRRTASSPLVNT